jgi:hypothetical protein
MTVSLLCIFVQYTVVNVFRECELVETFFSKQVFQNYYECPEKWTNQDAKI